MVQRGSTTRNNAPPPYRGMHQKIVEAAQAVPNGVICLVSALELHGVVLKPNEKIWVAIKNKSRKPAHLPNFIRIVWISEAAFESGIKDVQMTGSTIVKAYSVAKSLVDCFKFRSQLQKEVPGAFPPSKLLKKADRLGKADLAEIQKFAELCRMSKVMAPFLQML